MSRCWDLRITPSARDASAIVEAEDLNDQVGLRLEYVDEAMTAMDLPEPAVRQLRDWLSWWLGEGPEPAS